jgi:glycosyltransferase involved in cell wall biosynthesis
LYRAGVKQDPDIIIAPEPDSLIVAYLIRRHIKKVKVIFDCHEWYNVHFTHVAKIKNQFLAGFLNRCVSFSMTFIAKRIEAVITVSDTMTEFFRKYNPQSFTIPSLTAQNIVPDMSLERKDFIYFGQFGNGGQEELLLGAARILKRESRNTKIKIIGGYHKNDSSKFDAFCGIIHKENLVDYIEIRSWMPSEEAFAALNTGLAGIMRFDTGYYGGLPALPNKIFEYMSMGMAVVCCKLNRDMAKIIEEEKCGIAVESETAEDLATALIYLHDNEQDCVRMGRNAFSAVQKKYNWNYYGDVLEEIIGKLK